MDFLLSVLKDALAVFFTTLAAGLAYIVLNGKNKTKKKSPAPRKRKGISSKRK